MPTSEVGHFWKKVDFWTKYKYCFKSFQRNQCVIKRPLRNFLGYQGSFTTRRDRWEHKQVKNAELKIWSFFFFFFAKNHGLTPWKKVDFWTKYKYSFKSFQSNQYIRKCALRHFEASQRAGDKEKFHKK